VQGLDLPFIIVSGNIGEEAAVEAVRAGAHDYIMKGNLTQLGAATERELREAEGRREKRRAEERYRSIFENAVEGIFQTTVEGRYLVANPALARMFGYGSPEELLAAVSSISDELYVDPARRMEFGPAGTPTRRRVRVRGPDVPQGLERGVDLLERAGHSRSEGKLLGPTSGVTWGPRAPG
jgi:PAS domain-containing protein